MHHIDLTTITLDKGSTADKGETHGCVMWTGHVEKNGYGKAGGRWAHRVALTRKLGRPITTGMDACHTCDVRLCVNPDHLYEGTRRQNMADATARGRHNKPSGERHWRSKLTDREVAAMREAAASGAAYSLLALRYRVHPATVSRIVRGIWRREVAAA